MPTSATRQTTRSIVDAMHPLPPMAAPRSSRWRRLRRKESLAGYVFLSPWLLGLLTITAIPMLYSLYLSFTDYDVVSSPEWVGMDNYQRMFTSDPQYWHAVQVTVVFAVVAVPLKVAAGLGVALLLYRERRGAGAFRALFYLPAILGGSVAIAVVWQAMFSGGGAFNQFLALFGIPGRPWVNDPDTALATLIVLAVWQLGAPMVIFLAGLKQIPTDYFEAAALDGAGKWRTFRNVILPILSPVIFFNMVLETIAGFQGFTAAYVISNGTGGPTDSTLVYSLYLYLKGFGDLEMGYASAMAWVFLVSVGALTAMLFAVGRFWVHYADDWGL